MDKRLRHLALLRCFAAAAKEKSYSVAADKLAITQAAVSQQVRKLEDVLGARLFVRIGRNMVLTPQGETLYHHVNEAFETLLSGFDKVQQEPLEGLLNVTTGMSFASMWLVPRLWRFSAVYPQIRIKVIVSAELENLRHSELDVAIRQGSTIDHTIENHLLFEDPVYAVCSPSLIEKKSLTSVHDLRCAYLLEAENPGRFSWKNWFESQNLQPPGAPHHHQEVTTLEMGINASLNGQGVFLASHCLVKGLIEQGQLVRPFEHKVEPGLRYTLLFDECSPKKARIQAFSQWLIDELSDDSLMTAEHAQELQQTISTSGITCR